MALIRYPGSKDKVAPQIVSYFPWSLRCPLFHRPKQQVEYREPFFGAGAVGFRMMKVLPPGASVWINDLDPGMAALWEAVLKSPRELMVMVQKFTPSVDQFYKFKELDGTLSGVQSGFAKLALHQMSFSGLGAMAGGPIGGKCQGNSAYDVACRWNAQALCEDIVTYNRYMTRYSNIRVTCEDFSGMMTSADDNCFVYCDPPYYEKGPQLYKHSMDHDDHVRLAKAINNSGSKWVLSYDDHPEVRGLYPNSEFNDLEFTYSIASTSGQRPKNREVVITPREHARC